LSWTYPPNDLWCEFLSHEDGDWTYWGYGPGSLALTVDAVDYKVGALSIRMDCTSSYYGSTSGALILHFKEGRELNLTNADALEFWVKMSRLNGNGGFVPSLTVILVSSTGPRATKGFTVSTSEWQLMKCGVGPSHFAEWIVEEGFDWTKITEIWFNFDQNASYRPFDVPTEYFRVDGVLFYFLLSVSFITAESNPITGVPVRIDGAQFKTPVTWELEPPGVRTVTVDEEFQGWTFDHWEDGTTTPGRVVDASQPGFYRVTAFYKAPPSPPTPRVWKLGYFIQYFMTLIQKSLRRRR
jgi:hypothetical protein